MTRFPCPVYALQDTQVCPAARVFYVAYKWVEEYWPNNLDTPDNHITAHPIRFYLDGQDTEVELTAKLRLYRKAVHLVICEQHTGQQGRQLAHAAMV